MTITEEELKELIEIRADVDTTSTISSDGKNLLTRIPKEVKEELNLQKGNKIRWLVDKKKNIIKLEIQNETK